MTKDEMSRIKENQNTAVLRDESQATSELSAAHSPLPWHGAKNDSTMLVAADHARVADCSVAIGMDRTEMEANAQLIIRAVNAHAALALVEEENP